MAGTVTTDQVEVHDCDSQSDWTPAPTLDTEVYIEGTGSLSAKVSKSTYNSMKSIISDDLSDTIIYVWILGGAVSQFDTKVNGGIGISVSDGVNTNTWYVAGSDSGYGGGWQVLSIRTTSTPDVNGGATMSTITSVGVRFKVLSTAAKINCWWDRMAYGTSITIYAGTSGSPATLSDIVTAEATNRYGIFTEIRPNFYEIIGKLKIGSTSAGVNTYFEDGGYQVISFADLNFGTDYFEVTGQGNATGDTRIFFGEKVGGRGGNGLIIKSEGTTKAKIDFDNVNIDYLGFYGSTFVDCAAITFPTSSVNREMLDCVFAECKEISPNTLKIQYCTIRDADTNGMHIISTSHEVSYCNFINNPYSVRFSIAGTYPCNGNKFFGADGSTLFDIKNEANSTIADFYPEPNQDSDEVVGNGTITAVGQSFTGNGNVLSRVILWLKKVGSLTGTAVAKIYLATGSDPNQIPTGAALATSNTITANDITASYSAIDFEFEDEFTLVNATEYFIVLEYNKDVSNYIHWGSDQSTPPSGSNFASYTGSWVAVSGSDGCFYIYTGGILKLTLSNDADPVYDDNTGTPPGVTIMPISVNLTITIKRKDTKAVIQYAEVSIHRIDNNLELMNEQTSASGIATESHVYSGVVNIYWRVREIPGSDPQYFVESSEDEITADGFTRTVFLEEDPNIDDVST